MWVQADLDALEKSIKQGVKRVEYDDQIVEYQSMKDMMMLRADMKREISGAPRVRYARHNRG